MTEAAINPADTVPGSIRPTPGEYLRKLREEKGHTHAAVGQALHLTVHYIKALEGDEYGKLPGLTFVKGYLRAYARFLGADVDNVLTRFDEHIAGLLDAGQHTARVERSKRRQDQALRWAIGAGFVVVAGIAGGWWFMSDRAPVAETAQRSAPAQQQAAPVTPAPQTTAAVTPPRSAAPLPGNFMPPAVTTSPAQSTGLRVVPEGTVDPALAEQGAAAAPATETQTAVSTGANANPPAADVAADTASPISVTPAVNGARQVSLVGVGNDQLRVSFNGNSWIEVDDGSMVRLYNDMLSAGDTLTIRGQAPFHVLLGDASNVAVSVNATPVDISADIRADSTARLVLTAPAATTAPAPVERAPAATDQAPAAPTEEALL